MKVLIIYENVPESTDIYIVDVSPGDWKWMQLTHGHYGGHEMGLAHQAAVEQLSTYLQECEKDDREEPIDLVAEKIERLVLTGWIM